MRIFFKKFAIEVLSFFYLAFLSCLTSFLITEVSIFIYSASTKFKDIPPFFGNIVMAPFLIGSGFYFVFIHCPFYLLACYCVKWKTNKLVYYIGVSFLVASILGYIETFVRSIGIEDLRAPLNLFTAVFLFISGVSFSIHFWFKTAFGPDAIPLKKKERTG